jgi:hypothetical protein
MNEQNEDTRNESLLALLLFLGLWLAVWTIAGAMVLHDFQVSVALLVGRITSDDIGLVGQGGPPDVGTLLLVLVGICLWALGAILCLGLLLVAVPTSLGVLMWRTRKVLRFFRSGPAGYMVPLTRATYTVAGMRPSGWVRSVVTGRGTRPTRRGGDTR